MKGFLSNLVTMLIACVLIYAVVWAVFEAVSSMRHAKAEVKKAEDRRDLAQIRLREVLVEREEWSAPFFVIIVNVGEDLDDLRACMDFAWTVCEAEGEVVCGMDVRGDCAFNCCPEEE